MTLTEIADYICTATQQVEDADKTACKTFLSKRYELIWNEYLWKDSLTMVDISLAPQTNPEHAAGIVPLPTQIDRVVAMRTSDNGVKIHALEEYFRNDWNRFADTSDLNGLVEFAILNPVWKTFRPASFTTINISGTLAGGGETGVYAYAVTPGARYKVSASTNISGIYDGDYGGISVPATGWQAQNSLVTFAGTNGSAFTATLQQVPTLKTNQTIPGASLQLTSDNAADLNSINVKIVWRDSQDRYTVNSQLPLTLTPQDGSGFIEIETIFFSAKLTGNLTLTVNSGMTELAGGTGAVQPWTYSAGTLAPTLKTPSYSRVRLFGKPTQPMTLSLLGKKPFVALDFGNEVPGIRNVDNCLIAFGTAAMLERARQYGKANSKMQEASVLLSELAKLEAMQAANNQRFMPESGYGDAFFGPGSNRGIWW